MFVVLFAANPAPVNFVNDVQIEEFLSFSDKSHLAHKVKSLGGFPAAEVFFFGWWTRASSITYRRVPNRKAGQRAAEHVSRRQIYTMTDFLVRHLLVFQSMAALRVRYLRVNKREFRDRFFRTMHTIRRLLIHHNLGCALSIFTKRSPTHAPCASFSSGWCPVFLLPCACRRRWCWKN